MTVPFLPDQASTGAQEVDHLMLLLLGMAVFFIFVTAGPLLFFSFRYRRSQAVNRVISTKGTVLLEVAWTLIPSLIGLGFFFYSAAIYFRQRHPPADAAEIHVVGKQWMWKVQHPNGKREINALHLPVGVATKLLMASQDVIHSVYIPAFRLKQDAVPGYFTTLWFVPNKVGVYHLFCAEYCGTQHSGMIGSVTVMSQSDYQAWLVTGEQDESPVLAGAKLFRSLGCSGCHEGSGAVRAPDLHGLYGSVVPLEGGYTKVADERYLRDSIFLPNLDITAGYEAIMPSYQGRISEGDLMAIIAYLKSLPRKQAMEKP